MKNLFPQIPDDISGLSDDEIASLIAQCEEALDKVESGDVEGSQAEVYEETAKGVEGLERLRDEQGAREAAATENAEKMAELIKRGRGQSGDGEPDDESDDGEGEDDKDGTPNADGEDDKSKDVRVAATTDDDKMDAFLNALTERVAERIEVGGDRMIEAAQKHNEKLRVGAAREDRQPVGDSTDVVIFASADIPGFPMGTKIESGEQIAKAFGARMKNLGTASMEGESVPVVQMSWTEGYPTGRRLDGIDEEGIMQRIREVVGDAPKGRADSGALLASGGLCAPVEIRYDLPVLAQADRPVRDNLPNFNATRGGLRFATPPSLASITTAVGRQTVAQDLAAVAKTCQTIACPAFVEVDIAAIYHCLQFGNMGARTFPELIENSTELTMAAQARLAETALLDAMSAASIHATVALQPNNTNPLGANAILLPALLRACAGMRNRQRMDPEAILDVQMPAWTLDLLTSDLVRSAFDRFAANDGDLVRTMESYGLRINFYWDGLTAVAQTFGAQANNSPLLTFPPTVEFFMYPAGSFLLLDGGTLDLGLVRDSTLNRTNDYQMFAETWENLAFVGLESLRVSASVCDTGAVAAAVQSVCGS